MHRLACPDVGADPVTQDLEQCRHCPDPPGKRRTIEVDALSSKDVALAMQGKMVAVFGDQNVGEQVEARAAAFDRRQVVRQGLTPQGRLRLRGKGWRGDR